MEASNTLDHRKCLASVSNLLPFDRFFEGPLLAVAGESRAYGPLLRTQFSLQLRIHPSLPVLDRTAVGVVGHTDVWRGALRFRGLWKRRYH